MKLRRPSTPRLADRDAERVRRSHERVLRDHAAAPAMELIPLGAFSLVDGVEKVIPHKLGREPKQLILGPPRGPSSTGRIEEVKTGSRDRRKVIVLKATGWGATIGVDVSVL